jgi:NAD(P)-dependent dehydrogenase (short-subunit alcohol dehydrogenase family)
MKSLKELMNLKGRVALITGGAGHIGYAAANALAELGANIVLLDINKKLCDKNAKLINKKYGVATLSLAIDLSDDNAIKSVPHNIKRKFRRLDIIVNCAAMMSFKDSSSNTWEKALKINLTAISALAQACKKDLSVSGHGSVINISSIYGLVGPDMRLYENTGMSNSLIYSTSKGGLLQLTRWLATTLAPKIRVNAISPGGILRNQPRAFSKRYAERTPLGRMATEEDIKGAVLYLASDLSAYVTGQNLIVDGGWTIW